MRHKTRVVGLPISLASMRLSKYFRASPSWMKFRMAHSVIKSWWLIGRVAEGKVDWLRVRVR
jgi:hypothetical protein